MDVNGNSNLTVSDVLLIFKKINGSAWQVGQPTYRIFTQQEWSSIQAAGGNPALIFPGTQNLVLTNPATNGSSNLYIIKTGHAN
jgi:hypothetical protein